MVERMGYILEEINMTLDGGSSAMDNSILEKSADSGDIMDEINNSLSFNIFKQHRRKRSKKKRYKSVGDEEDFDILPSFRQLSSEPDVLTDEKDKTLEDSLEDSDNTPSPNKKRRLSSVIIRPIHVPKAPENSTQFIIDDHEDSQLYISFEKPFESNISFETELTYETFNKPYESDAAFQDIDYEYASADDVDTTCFFARDFETAYYKAKFDELMQIPHNKLIDMYHDLDQQAIKLQNELMQYDPMYALDDLQRELLKHQEENKILRQTRKNLKKKLCLAEGESGKDSSSSD